MPTVFIAIQCCQCSTMQVKQQKKSSNKWTCVVCNEKQSVRKVYAQGFMAKDVRKFVQNFNMSRQLAEQNLPNFDEQEEALEIGDQIPSNGKQKRTDWTEYIEPEEDSSNAPYSLGENNGDEFEPKIVTEMPKPVSKKPKLKSYRIAKDSADDNEETSVGNFGGRHISMNSTFSAVESSRCHNAMVRGTQQERTDHAAESKRKFADIQEGMKPDRPMHRMSEWKVCFIQNDDTKFANELPRRIQSSTANRQSASKWSCYMEEEEEPSTLLLGRGKDLKTQADELNNQHAFETEFMDQRVEEDIHPDFL